MLPLEEQIRSEVKKQCTAGRAAKGLEVPAIPGLSSAFGGKAGQVCGFCGADGGGCGKRKKSAAKNRSFVPVSVYQHRRHGNPTDSPVSALCRFGLQRIYS